MSVFVELENLKVTSHALNDNLPILAMLSVTFFFIQPTCNVSKQKGVGDLSLATFKQTTLSTGTVSLYSGKKTSHWVMLRSMKYHKPIQIRFILGHVLQNFMPKLDTGNGLHFFVFLILQYILILE